MRIAVATLPLASLALPWRHCSATAEVSFDQFGDSVCNEGSEAAPWQQDRLRGGHLLDDRLQASLLQTELKLELQAPRNPPSKAEFVTTMPVAGAPAARDLVNTRPAMPRVWTGVAAVVDPHIHIGTNQQILGNDGRALFREDFAPQAGQPHLSGAQLTSCTGGGGYCSCWVLVIESLILFVALGVPLLMRLLNLLLTAMLRQGIHSLNRRAFGCETEIDELELNIYSGYLRMNGLVVRNPKTKTGSYTSAYLLKAGRVAFKIDMLSFVCSLGMAMEVQRLVCKDFDVIYERSKTSSNVHDILQHLLDEEKPKTSGEHKKDKTRHGMFAWFRREEHEKEPELTNEDHSVQLRDESKMVVRLRTVVVEDVGVRAQAQVFGGHGFRVAVGDIRYEDFTKELGDGHHLVEAMLKELMKSLLKTIVVNVVGKKVGDHWL
mmetsp:Transcript_61502/g.170533  ORF Transcript_61502/g.170533 Transcript_61502/m.170533 type:complete len:435 (+) Transcript_61502:48-1352(+)|eukprot:CAMPEP_0179067528 /NCGR_PEP_ID=MMETSP0796-20121207/29533_1 /TAXON_ID=73915 /ORGANISM="Pyrodinium bahamense, Strain pbaha01" /LENGTH=434 /DNA_ID=CAMNT_0020764555 /DNA_START=38 /DNA_END=1342 /DNA_ORIENTATION=+